MFVLFDQRRLIASKTGKNLLWEKDSGKDHCWADEPCCLWGWTLSRAANPGAGLVQSMGDEGDFAWATRKILDTKLKAYELLKVGRPLHAVPGCCTWTWTRTPLSQGLTTASNHFDPPWQPFMDCSWHQLSAKITCEDNIYSSFKRQFAFRLSLLR